MHLRLRQNLLQIKLYYKFCDLIGYQLIDDFSLTPNLRLELPKGFSGCDEFII